jgi:glycosyltransferase involved in cell wall biosynthesis
MSSKARGWSCALALRFKLARGNGDSPTGVLDRGVESQASDPPFAGVGPTNPRWEPLVSIIIPAYNHEGFVAQCLDSVVADDYPNKEIVVIDDGSSDGTLDVIESWADGHRRAIPITVVSRPNRGATRTLNELLHLARGELVLPVASDDYLLPGGVRALVTALAADPTCRAVFGDCIVVDEAGEMILPSTLFGYRRTNRDWLVRRLADELITNWTVAGAALLYVRKPILSIGGYSEDLLVEDWDFYLRLAAKGWLRFVDCKVSAYRLHAGNQHRNPKTERRRENEQRKVALRAARHYRGRRRLLLLLMALSLSPPLVGLRRGKLTHLPLRAAKKAIKVTAQSLASFG